MRCLKTGNPCGTDTYLKGCECECANCETLNEDRNTNTAANVESSAKNALAKKISDKWNYKTVRVHCHSVRKRLADYDGVSIKAALDGVVETGVLIDDNLETVEAVTFSQEKGSEEKTIIEIIEV